ncbi:pyridoxal phosphate-dependent aminotransferase [Candidatus Amarolinea aalborgensis]|uniref:pyridoxal phosphate-dependent aminotransferase n=1 Tax=Candidatus Amarolinea aalborgensis TaxID=2249329 RepID=UPI003BF9E0F9
MTLFSGLVAQFSGAANALTQAQARVRASNRPLIDLINGNPTQHGLQFPAVILQTALQQAQAAAALYHPHPKGQAVARAAISAYYAAQGARFDPEQILLTPGTSQSYWYLFQLLADPGQEILTPQPSYPLFDYIAALCRVTLTPYPLARTSTGWAVDTAALAAAVTPRTRAIVLISPHNPTGHVASAAEVEALVALAQAHRLPIIADEVFCEFIFGAGQHHRPARLSDSAETSASSVEPLIEASPKSANHAAPLVFTLNGFSKMLALPGVKLGWIAVSGEPALVATAVAALETIADTFLATHEMIQWAAPALLAQGQAFLASYRQQIAARAALAHELLAGANRFRVTPAAGGFYLTLDVSELTRNDEHLALDLLLETGILTHPGWYYDMPMPSLVLSFLSEPDRLAAHLPRLRAYLEAY